MKKLMKVINLLLVILLLCPPHYVRALPEGESVVSGSADFSYLDANTLNITTSDRVIIDYQSFSIAQPETVRFIQPSGSSIALNRVTGGDPSSILGSLLANGRIFLINPNGILFGPNSRVDTAGLVASTLDISNQDFLEGRLNFQGAGGYIINQGLLTAKPGGYICLLSGAVDNQGAIQTVLGTVVLASGEMATLNLDDLGQISVVIDESVKQEVFGPDGEKQSDAVKNSGTISAAGGIVTLTANVLNDIFDHAVNNSGKIEAKSLVERNGEIILSSENGSVINSGEIVANGSADAPDAGNIFVRAENILHNGILSADADNGGKAGEIEVISGESTILDEGSRISARALGESGEGGSVLINSLSGYTFVDKDAVVDVSGGILAGDAGFIEISAAEQLGFHGALFGTAATGYRGGRVLFDPRDITIATDGGSTVDGGDNSTGIDEASGESDGLDLTFDPATAFAGFVEIFLQATRDIFVNNVFNVPLAVGVGTPGLRLEAGNNIEVNESIIGGEGFITLDADNLITIDADVTTTTGDIKLITGDLEIGAAVQSDSGNISLIPLASNTIGLGTAVGDFTLDNDEIGLLSTDGTVTIGDLDSGDIIVEEFEQPEGFDKLTLISEGTINDTADDNASITIDTLKLLGSAIGDDSIFNIDVNYLSAQATDGAINIENSGDLNLTSVIGDDNVSVTVDSGNLVVGSLSATDTITLSASGDITDGNGADINIDSNTFRITSANDVGSEGDRLDTATYVLDFDITGSVYLIDEDDVAIESIISTGGGDVNLTATEIRDNNLGSGTDISAHDINLNVGSSGTIGGSGVGEEIDLVYTGVFTETVVPNSTTADSAEHTLSIWSNDNTVTVSWSAATDPGNPSSGIDGYSYVWDTSNTTLPDTVKDTDSITITSPELNDGNLWYFHVRAIDKSGNGSTTYHLGPFYIDATSPQINVADLLSGTYSSSQTLTYSTEDLTNLTLSGPLSGATYDSTGTYSVVISATDEAGNITSKTLTFTILTTADSQGTTNPQLTGTTSPTRSFDNVSLFLGNYRVNSFNPNPTFYFYHPIVNIDNSAFSNLIMDIDAYEFIEDSLKLKKSLPIYFSAP